MADGSARNGVAGTVVAAALLAFAATKTATSGTGTADESATRPDGATGPALRTGTHKTGVLGRIDLWQQRHRATAFPVGVLKKFGDDRAGRLAALIAYYGFFSVFPALLAMVTILLFVLKNRPGLRTDIADSAVAQLPVVGDEIAKSLANPIGGSTIGLVIGLAGALWAGLGMVQASQDAMNEVWAVERSRYPNFIMKRVRSLIMLALMGSLVIASTIVSQLVSIVAPGVLGVVLLFAATVALNVLVFMVAFRVLTVADLDWATVLPGAAFAGVAYTVIQYFGGIYVSRTVNGASDTYGTFAIVIGLLSWIFIIAQVTMLGAEINSVRATRLWPRSLFNPPATAGDHRSHAAQAKAQKMDSSMDVDVEFDSTPARV
ncbi:MAG: YihY/virulence factor BrkB family protein [Actinobacteria bacterium]|nr:YihY/virulence factor BrkB family protein [Actinomycetota bacterium]